MRQRIDRTNFARMSSRSNSKIVAGLVATLAGAALGGPEFAIDSSSRTLSVFADSDWCQPVGERFEIEVEGAGLFDESIDSGEGCAIATTIAWASQESMVPESPASILSCSGSASTFCDAFLATDMFADGTSVYDVQMTIEERVRYEIRGHVEASASGDLIRIFSEAQVLLQHPNMAVPHFYANARPDSNNAPARVEFDATGLLDPGPVQLLVHAKGDIDRPVEPIHGESTATYMVEFRVYCLADFAAPVGTIDVFDMLAYLELFATEAPIADFTGDGIFDVFDVLAYLEAFEVGCS